jgi:anthranilate phosphoribosyltransferase
VLDPGRNGSSLGGGADPLYILKREEYFIITGKRGLPEVTATDETALCETADNSVLWFLAVAETHLTNRV